MYERFKPRDAEVTPNETKLGTFCMHLGDRAQSCPKGPSLLGRCNFKLVPMSLQAPSSQCPFKLVNIEGVPHKIHKGLVVMKGKTPSGWSGTFRWHVNDRTPEMFEERLMRILRGEPSAGATPTARERAGLAQTPGFRAPGYSTPDRPASPSPM